MTRREWLKEMLLLYEKQRVLDREHRDKQMALNKEMEELLKVEPPKDGTCPEKK